MRTIRPSYPNNPASIPLLVPLGEDFKAVDDVLPELESHLKKRFPAISEVRLRLRNRTPTPDAVAYATYLHDASLVLVFTGKTIAATVIAAVSKEAIEFLKRRVKRIRAGNKKRETLRRSRAKKR